MTTDFQSLKPCIDAGGHRFTANYVGFRTCERCGMTPDEARFTGPAPDAPAGRVRLSEPRNHPTPHPNYTNVIPAPQKGAQQ